MQKRMGDGEHFPLKYILLAWFDQLDKFATNYYLDFPIEEQLTEDTKLVYFGSGESFGSNGYPSDQIFELPIKPPTYVPVPAILLVTLMKIILIVLSSLFHVVISLNYSSIILET